MYVQNFLSQIWYTYRNGTCSKPQYDVKMMVYYAAEVFGNEFADSFLNCFKFGASIELVTRKRLGLYSDFTDFGSSFMFNLLANSVSIKNIGSNIAVYSN